MNWTKSLNPISPSKMQTLATLRGIPSRSRCRKTVSPQERRSPRCWFCMTELLFRRRARALQLEGRPRPVQRVLGVVDRVMFEPVLIPNLAHALERAGGDARGQTAAAPGHADAKTDRSSEQCVQKCFAG